jgi:predicted nucleic acid-binding protein
VLLTAKTAGLIPVVKPELEKLAETNFYFSEELRVRILNLAGEQ